MAEAKLVEVCWGLRVHAAANQYDGPVGLLYVQQFGFGGKRWVAGALVGFELGDGLRAINPRDAAVCADPFTKHLAA